MSTLKSAALTVRLAAARGDRRAARDRVRPADRVAVGRQAGEPLADAIADDGIGADRPRAGEARGVDGDRPTPAAATRRARRAADRVSRGGSGRAAGRTARQGQRRDVVAAQEEGPGRGAAADDEERTTSDEEGGSGSHRAIVRRPVRDF